MGWNNGTAISKRVFHAKNPGAMLLVAHRLTLIGTSALCDAAQNMTTVSLVLNATHPPGWGTNYLCMALPLHLFSCARHVLLAMRKQSYVSYQRPCAIVRMVVQSKPSGSRVTDIAVATFASIA